MDRQELLNATGLTQASDLQVEIFSFLNEQIEIRERGGNPKSLIVEAVAGSGKTTTIVAASRLTQILGRQLKVLFLAFNKSIADELKERLPEGIDARTLNSLGDRVWRRYSMQEYGNHDVKAFKCQKIFRNLFNRPQDKEYKADVLFLVGMCKSLGIIPASMIDQGFEPINGMVDTDENLTRIGRHFNKNIPVDQRPTVFNMARRVLEASLKDGEMIDFDDQKYMTVTKRIDGRSLPTFKHDIIIIDEVQDVNAVDIALIKMNLKPNGIVIGVGDSRQAIYGFRGADTKSIENFKVAFDAEIKPLSITYRCGEEIVRHAQEIVPTIQAAPNAPAGSVLSLDKYTARIFQPDDLIICRNNAPTIEMAYKLIRERVSVFVKGRDIGKNLISLIQKLVGKEVWVNKKPTQSVEGKTVLDLLGALQDWQDQQVQIIRQEDPDNEDAIQRVTDQADSVRVFTQDSQDGSVQTVIDEITKLFGTTDKGDEKDLAKGKVVLSTVHKSKGLEAERVFILEPDLFFPPYLDPRSWQYTQEENLVYVARTRAKFVLGYIAINGLDDTGTDDLDEQTEAAKVRPNAEPKPAPKPPAPKAPAGTSSRLAALRARQQATPDDPDVDDDVPF